MKANINSFRNTFKTNFVVNVELAMATDFLMSGSMGVLRNLSMGKGVCSPQTFMYLGTDLSSSQNRIIFTSK